jgi:hypothetical protein
MAPDPSCVSSAPDLAGMVAHSLGALNTIMTTIIAVAIGGVTYLQFRLAQRKLALDLFDKRMKVYNALMEAARDTTSPETRDNGYMNFVTALPERLQYSGAGSDDGCSNGG